MSTEVEFSEISIKWNPLNLFSDYCFGLKLKMLVRRIWYWINKKNSLIDIFLYPLCLSAWYSPDVVRRNSVSVIRGNSMVNIVSVQVSFELPDPMFCIQCWHNNYEKRKDISIQPHFVKISCYTDFATRIIQNFAGTSRASSYEPNWPGWPAYRDEFRLEFIWENSARFPRWEKAEDPGDEFWREIRKTKQRWRNATKLLLLRLLWLWQPF